VNKWRKIHSGIEGEEMTAAQLAEYKKIKAELREARLEIDFRDKTAAFFSDGSPSQKHDTLAPPRRGQLPDPFDVPLSGGVATSPEGRCAGSCSLEGLVACHTLPQGPQLPCLLPTWQGAPT